MWLIGVLCCGVSLVDTGREAPTSLGGVPLRRTTDPPPANTEIGRPTALLDRLSVMNDNVYSSDASRGGHL